MAITYQLASNPKWYIADLVGRPLGGGYMYTYRSLDKTQLKFIFQDPGGNFPWPDPVLFDENGSQGPFYWQVDSANPNETYYVEVYDANGVLQWTIDGFLPTGGGGSVVTTGLHLNNLVINNVFWRNVGPIASPLATSQYLAPGAHAAITYSADITTNTCAPDIQFFKNNTNATDSISFPLFTLGSNALTADVTPPAYMNYTCTNSPAGETFKYVQFPITPDVQNLSNQGAVVTIWARVNSGTATLVLQWMQFFGDGVGASAPLITPIQTLALTGAWQKFQVTANIPDVTGKVIGLCGNSALFLQVQYPLGSACNIDFVKPCLYLGTIAPAEEYDITDDNDAVINSPRTGDIDITSSVANQNRLGWVVLNDGSIGSATSSATTRANIDTFPLFKALWDSTVNPNCQTQDNAGNPVARGASAAADFDTNNRRITLPLTQGRVLAGLSGVLVNAQSVGVSVHAITVPELPPHTHPATSLFLEAGSGGGSFASGSASQVAAFPATGSTGGGVAMSLMQPTTFFQVIMKL
jgi:hypothetical protein